MEGKELENTILFIAFIPVVSLLVILVFTLLKEQVVYKFYDWVYAIFGVSIGRYFTFGVYRLTQQQEYLLNTKFKYYRRLNPIDRKQFNHRVRKFIKNKEFIGREGVVITDDMKLLLAANAIMLSFGFGKYELYNFSKILIYPQEYYSTITKQYHKGEANTRGIVVVSWKHFKEGIDDDADNLNLGIHEFAHAYWQEAKELIGDHEEMQEYGEPSMTHNFLAFSDLFADPKYKEMLQQDEILRGYAFTNRDEFFAVTCEYFFETPKQLQKNAPRLYGILSKMLNQDTAKLYG